MKFEVGDPVFCERFGKGEVVSVNNEYYDPNYPMTVSFDCGLTKHFTLEGCFLFCCPRPGFDIVKVGAL